MSATASQSRPGVSAPGTAGRGNQGTPQDYGSTAGKASSVGEPYQPFPWFKLDSSDWLASTRGLSLSQTGALIILRAMIHERGEPLPEDYARLGRQCGAPSSKAFERVVDALVDAKLLFREGGGLWCRDIAEQIDHQRGVSRAAKENRSKVGKKTKQNQRAPSTGVPRYKSKIEDTDREGAPMEPPSSTDNSSEHDTDAPAGASGHERSYVVGQAVEISGRGYCRIVGVKQVMDDMVTLTIRDSDSRENFLHNATRTRLIGTPYPCPEIEAPVPAKQKGRSSGAA